MTHNSAVAPFTHDGGSVGIVFCHGFTGSPASMRPWADFMMGHGYSIRLPLLPGHGTTWKEMARTRWNEWYDADAAAFHELRARCDQVFLFGLSMGGTLALRVAQQEGTAVSGLVLVNPLVHRPPAGAQYARFLHPFVPSLKAVGNDIKKPGSNEHAYDRVPVRGVAELATLSRDVATNIRHVTQPLLIVTSVDDHLVDPANSQWLAEHAASSDKASLVLTDSYHVATLDHDAPRVFDAALQFVRRVAA